jgi:hypothetical protein
VRRHACKLFHTNEMQSSKHFRTLAGAPRERMAPWTAPRPRRASVPARKGRGMSAAQRKAVGERMKAYWAKRRGEKTGRTSETESASDGAATQANQPSKRKSMSPAARKAQGERMRAYWAARRSEKSAGDGSTTRSRKGRKTGRKK